MEKIIVTKMEERMIEDCVDLFINTFSKEPWNDVYESREQVTNFFRNHFLNNYFIGYVAIINNKIEALSIGFKKPWINGLEYYIDEFCVNYTLQGQGVGSVFLQEIEKDIKKNGLNAILLNTEKEYPSYGFYEKNGFEEIKGLIIMSK